MTTDEMVQRAFAEGMVQVKQEITDLVNFLYPLGLCNMLEIGSESGGTFYLWCRVISGVKISLDLPSGASGSGIYRDAEKRRARNEKMRGWSVDAYMITGDSHSVESLDKVRGLLAGEMLDFLFIDGDHSYEGVKQDFEMYRKFVRSGGWIAFHDIKNTEHHRHRDCYVAQFWDELPGEKMVFDAGSYWGGIGLVKA